MIIVLRILTKYKLIYKNLTENKIILTIFGNCPGKVPYVVKKG